MRLIYFNLGGLGMISFLMVGSLVLGLVAWTLPSINIVRYKRNYNRNWAIYSITSISICAVAICFQLIYSNHIVKIEDWAALMDTIGTSTVLSIILLISTLTLNTISLIMYRSKR